MWVHGGKVIQALITQNQAQQLLHFNIRSQKNLSIGKLGTSQIM